MNVSRREGLDATGMNCTFLSGTLLRGQGYEGERRSELRSPLFPLELPLSEHAAAVRFGCVNIVTGRCMRRCWKVKV